MYITLVPFTFLTINGTSEVGTTNGRVNNLSSRYKMYEHIDNHPVFRNCEDCLRYNKMILSLDPIKEKKEWSIAFDLYKRHDPKTHTTAPPKTTHKGNGSHQGLFVGTLTMSPADPYNEEDMIGAMRKIFSQNTVPVIKWAWYREYTKNGVPHIHFCYETESGGRIHKKIFQRYWKIWDEPRNQTGRGGFPGGYHSPAKSEIAYLEYMSKDGGRSGYKGFKLENEILQPTDK